MVAAMAELRPDGIRPGDSPSTLTKWPNRGDDDVEWRQGKLCMSFVVWWRDGARTWARRSSRRRWWLGSPLQWRQKGGKKRMKATAACGGGYGGSPAERSASPLAYGLVLSATEPRSRWPSNLPFEPDSQILALKNS
jgi:hypothetical protein